MSDRKGDPEQARRINRSLILNAVRRQDRISRAELARMLSISKMTASTIVRELIENEFLTEQSSLAGPGASGGRPPVMLSLNENAKLVIGIDVGTTSTALRLSNLRGYTIDSLRVPTRRNLSVASVTEQIEELVGKLGSASPNHHHEVIGVGVSVAGLVEKTSGYVHFSPDFNWRDVQFRRLLEDRLGLPVVVNNCTRVAALGEWWYGAARERSNFFYVNVGYGIGSAIVSDGRLLERNSEFGHIHVTTQPVRCECGKTGCLEAVSSGHAIEGQANETLPRDKDEWITAEQVAERARRGDMDASRILTEAGKYLGRGISTVANLLSPELVIVGGGVSRAGHVLFDPLTSEFNRHTMEQIRNGVNVVPSELGMDAGVVGAVALALDSFVFGPERIVYS